MANNMMKTAVKLQRAINSKGYRIVITTTQFFAENRNQPITVYHIKESIYNTEDKTLKQTELFKSASIVQVVLYLKTLWEEINKENDNGESSRKSTNEKTDVGGSGGSES